MAGPVACHASRLTSYSGTGFVRHCRRAVPLVVVLVMGLGNGGCALSGQLGSLFGSDVESKPAPETTGSIARNAKPVSDGLPPEADLAFARAAATDVLTRGGKDTSAPWENPGTGARGTVTPIAVAYSQGGATCRDFLASHVSGSGSQAWMQGEACKNGSGRWEVRALKPWTRS